MALRWFYGIAGLAAAMQIGAAPATAQNSPSLLGIGIGQFDQDWLNPDFGFLDLSGERHDRAVDFRLEYRFGQSLLRATEPYASVRPWVGAEVTSDGGIYGGAGLLLDVPIGSIVFTPSIGAGLYSSGSGKELGSPLEFRSQLELGYEFENQSRFSLSYSHTSNADLAEPNPGANSVTLYYHVPTTWSWRK